MNALCKHLQEVSCYVICHASCVREMQWSTVSIEYHSLWHAPTPSRCVGYRRYSLVSLRTCQGVCSVITYEGCASDFPFAILHPGAGLVVKVT